MFSSLSAISSILLLAQLALPTHATFYNVHHRIFNPSSPIQPPAFRTRGSIDVSGPVPQFRAAVSVVGDLLEFAEYPSLEADDGEALYQVALHKPGPITEWSVSSVRLVRPTQLLLIFA